MIKALKIAALALLVPVVALSGNPAFAASPGQLAGGDNYVVKNLTQGGGYADSVNATCNDEVQFSMQLSNTHFGALDNVTLTATLPSNGGTSTATATTDLGGTSGTSDTASVVLGTNQTISYKAGSTVLYDGNGNVIRSLGDGVTNGGVNIGTIDGSTTEFVNFKAKVNCAPVIDVCPNIPGNQAEIPAGKVKDAQGNCVDKTTVTVTENKTAHTPAAIPSTGPAEIVSGFTGVTALGYGIRRYLESRNILK